MLANGPDFVYSMYKRIYFVRQRGKNLEIQITRCMCRYLFRLGRAEIRGKADELYGKYKNFQEIVKS
jgi:hypothetical protein